MARQLTLILGGARSGKSAHAETLARTLGPNVLYVATAEAGDNEMADRIKAHRGQRLPTWRTVEAPRDVGSAVEDVLTANTVVDAVLVDCLTLLASNVLVALPESGTDAEAEAALQREIDELLAVYERSTVPWLVVSNEVGLGIVPPYPLGRLYRDALGRANQRLAAQADRVLFMVAGLAMQVK